MGQQVHTHCNLCCLLAGMYLWKSEYSAFMRLAQFQYGRRLLFVPLTHFHQMAEQIGDPKAEIIFLFNTARCGSTLFNQVEVSVGA